MKIITKSPFNYVGNKFKQIPQLIKIFPQNINNFIDLFTGGADVAINVNAQHIFANDINEPVIEIMKTFQEHNIEEIFNFIDKRIEEFNLSKTNEKGYLQYRELYNTTEKYHTPLDLFTITRFSFNHFIRFNNKMKLNPAFGKNRCDFNSNMRNNTISFCEKIKSVHLSTLDFHNFDISKLGKNDFIYADPPYLIAKADYNLGKSAKIEWTQDIDNDLQAYLDQANQQGIQWGMSNFIKHQGNINKQLENWAINNEYNIYNIQSDYSKLTTKANRIAEPTIEVLITNYS